MVCYNRRFFCIMRIRNKTRKYSLIWVQSKTNHHICKIIPNTALKMILGITLSNFFSLNEKVTIDLQPANLQTKEARALADETEG